MRPAAWVLAALILSGAVLVGVELGRGALDEPAPKIADPCQPRAGRTGGLDATIQRIVLDGLDGAACRLHTTREELVLSFVPAAGTKRVRWTRPTVDAALRAGFHQAIKDTELRGVGGFVVGHILDVIVGAPLDFFLDLTDS